MTEPQAKVNYKPVMLSFDTEDHRETYRLLEKHRGLTPSSTFVKFHLRETLDRLDKNLENRN